MSTYVPERCHHHAIDIDSVYHEANVLSEGLSKSAEEMTNLFEEIQKRPSWVWDYTDRHFTSSEDCSYQEKLFDSLANIKIMTSQIAMHLDQEWREKLLANLDDLLDKDDWHEDDQLINLSSFSTFLRLIVWISPETNPGLGISNRGNIIAAWTNSSGERLTIESLKLDSVKWVLSVSGNDGTERAAGETMVNRLPNVLSPYSPQRWFKNGTA